MMRFFVKRPSVAEQFRPRAGLPPTMETELVEKCLRAVLTHAQEMDFGNQRVFTLQLQEGVLYALGRTAPEGKPYDVVLYRVLTQPEFDELRKQTVDNRPKKRMRSKAKAA